MMDVKTIAIPRKEAKRRFLEYKTHTQYGGDIDNEARRAYQLIAQGKTIIDARASIVNNGLGPDGRPVLAIARATAHYCYLDLDKHGAATFCDREPFANGSNAPRNNIKFPTGSFVQSSRFTEAGSPDKGVYRLHAKAIRPTIPIHLRPRRGLDNYHVLWEAEWEPVPPVDPLLLRRIGRSDLWLVVAGWDLTEVERAILASRMV